MTVKCAGAGAGIGNAGRKEKAFCIRRLRRGKESEQIFEKPIDKDFVECYNTNNEYFHNVKIFQKTEARESYNAYMSVPREKLKYESSRR